MAAEKKRRRANGEGSIYQRASDGQWVGMAYVYTTTGVRKRRPAMVCPHATSRSSAVESYLAKGLRDVPVEQGER